MEIAIDTDVFLRDPWLEGQEVRVLLNFLKRTHSTVLLLEPVYAELRERMKRDFVDSAGEVVVALRHGARKRLHSMPAFDSAASVEETIREWENNFSTVFSASELRRVPLNNTVLGEAIRRATARLAPCKKSGEGMRDAIIWLNFVEHAKASSLPVEFAFVTSNSDDYAGGDKVSLRDELQADLSGIVSPVRFFVNLVAFNKVHSNLIQHITPDWVGEKGITRAITEALENHFKSGELSDYFRVSSMDFEDYYQPITLGTVYSTTIEINDVTVWSFSEGHSELRIEFSVDVEADNICALMARPSSFWDRHYHDDLDDEYPSEKLLTCYAQLQGVIAAVDQDGQLIVGELEELERR